MFSAVAVRVVGLSLVVSLGSAADAYAERVTAAIPNAQLRLRGLTLPALRHEAVDPLKAREVTLTKRVAQPTRSPKCRRGRRALLGALIGAAGSIPIAAVAHERWENEAASGAGAAMTAVALGAALGAFVGSATCD